MAKKQRILPDLSASVLAAPATATQAAPAAPAGLSALASMLGTVEAPSAQDLPTLANPARIGEGKSVGLAFDGDTMILVFNIADQRVKGAKPALVKSGKNAGQLSKSATLAAVGSKFGAMPLDYKGLKLQVWLGVDVANKG